MYNYLIFLWISTLSDVTLNINQSMWSFDIYLVTFTTVDIEKSYIGCHRENIWLERGIYTHIIRYMILNFIQNDSLLHTE